jgi:Riboflavin kinase
VVEGFQRGSKQMGVPTANVAPRCVEHHFQGRPKGVYFGWAQLQRFGDHHSDGAVAPMVLNYGVRPTIKEGSNATVRRCRRGCQCHRLRVLHGSLPRALSKRSMPASQSALHNAPADASALKPP